MQADHKHVYSEESPAEFSGYITYSKVYIGLQVADVLGNMCHSN